MKKITLLSILILILTVAQLVQGSDAYNTRIIRVVDGDTVVVPAPYLPAPLKPQLYLRIYGVDTPEKGSLAKCEAEKSKGYAASKFTTLAVNNAKYHQITFRWWDKYGGRVLGDIILDGKSLRDLLISNGHAREYYGSKKTSWCN